MEYPCILNCANSCTLSDKIEEQKWSSIKVKSQKWIGLGMYGNVYTTTNWDTDRTKYYLHDDCYLTISSNDHFQRAKKRLSMETENKNLQISGNHFIMISSIYK